MTRVVGYYGIIKTKTTARMPSTVENPTTGGKSGMLETQVEAET